MFQTCKCCLYYKYEIKYPIYNMEIENKKYWMYLMKHNPYVCPFCGFIPLKNGGCYRFFQCINCGNHVRITVKAEYLRKKKIIDILII